LRPREGEKLEGLKASQDNTGAKVAPSAGLCSNQVGFDLHGPFTVVGLPLVLMQQIYCNMHL
jgi:hypothetical protein